MNRFVLLFLALLAVFAVPASAEVDFFIGPSADVQGSINPSGDADVLRFPVPSGSLVSLSVRAVTGDLQLDVRLASESGADVPLGTVATGRLVRVRRLHFPSGGIHTLTVSGVGTGDYRLMLRVSPPRRVSLTETFAPGYQQRRTFEFAGLSWSRVRLEITPAPGSAAEPCVENRGDSGCGSRRIRFDDRMRPDMRMSLEISNTSDLTGAIRVQGTIKPPSLAPKKWDLRAASLGFPSGGETAFAVQWDFSVSSDVSVSAGPIAGASIRHAIIGHAQVGSLGLTSAPEPTAAQLSGRLRLGPAVRYAAHVPFTRVFYGRYRGEGGSKPSQAHASGPMKLPFDPAALAAGADPELAVSVLRIDSYGRVTLFPPDFVAVDVANKVLLLTGAMLDPFVTYVAVTTAQ